MAQIELIMPKMGESIMEATILKWVKKEGDRVEEDETILEIATDKVDSEVPSPVSGVISEILFEEDETVEIGKVIALIATEGEETKPADSPVVKESASENGHSKRPAARSPEERVKQDEPMVETVAEARPSATGSGSRFYSPLVRNIARKENISVEELQEIDGTGLHGRVTKHDILSYLEERQKEGPVETAVPEKKKKAEKSAAPHPITGKAPEKTPVARGEDTEIVEMDRMRRLIADHMVESKRTSPHVTSFVEADVTGIVNWRERVKADFQKRYGEKITYTPIFIEAVVKAIKDFPMVNVSVDGSTIVVKKNINIGMAAALPSGNLIVPVIKDADHLSLLGMTKAVNDLAGRARENKLKADEIQGGTFTLTNVGTFGNVMGTPIINQPQVAILATGAIRKKPAVVETEYGDLVAVRHMMFLSLSYDHRVVDGFLGGSFLRRIADYLEEFDTDRNV